MSRPLHQLREVYKSAYGAIRDEGHSNASLPMIATYVLALESALTAALDRGRVVEVEPSVLGNATALHVAVYDNLRAGPVTLVLKKEVG